MTMRCADVLEQLATPTEAASPALAEHLAGCPRCAAWARRDARLAQLWEATRPAEPPPDAWPSAWSQVTQALDTALAPAGTGTILPVPASPWQRWAWTAFGIAQAAAILVAAVWLGAQPAPATAATTKVDLECGAPGWIRIDGNEVKVVKLTADENSNAVDPAFVMLDYFEAMAN
jgi:hypothetical protein